jgi:hypothetical protein
MEREVLLTAIKKMRLPIHTCSICGYRCSFYFKGDQLGYDSGCDCTYGRGGWQPRHDKELDFYLNEPTWKSTLEKFVTEANGRG